MEIQNSCRIIKENLDKYLQNWKDEKEMKMKKK